MSSPRHEFYETDEKLTLSIFDKGVDPDDVLIKFLPRSFTYSRGDISLVLEPLKGQIDPEQSGFTVGKVKVEIRLVKLVKFRWGALVGDSPDPLAPFPSQPAASASPPQAVKPKPFYKNWDGITESILSSDKPSTTTEDPNAGGDSSVNQFFQDIYSNANEDTKRAMMKSYLESGGTTLSTNWDEVGKAKVEVKPPQGSEWKQWAA